MATFVLDDAAVAMCATKLKETGQVVEVEARRARDLIMSLHRTAWDGAADSTANNSQQVVFAAAVAKLQQEIIHLSEALTQGQRTTTAADEASMEAFNAINPTGISGTGGGASGGGGMHFERI